MKTWSNWIHGT